MHSKPGGSEQGDNTGNRITRAQDMPQHYKQCVAIIAVFFQAQSVPELLSARASPELLHGQLERTLFPIPLHLDALASRERGPISPTGSGPPTVLRRTAVLVTFRLRFDPHRESFACNLEQVAILVCTQVNSAFYPQRDGK